MTDYEPGYEGSIAADPQELPELDDPPRDWDEFGPKTQAENLRDGIGDELFEWFGEE
jgi:hypothetical protein